jgi:hypothetical protein
MGFPCGAGGPLLKATGSLAVPRYRFFVSYNLLNVPAADITAGPGIVVASGHVRHSYADRT